MTETVMETTRYPVVDGALTEVPAYDHHKRGKNWLARIEADPRSPSGLDREFQEKAYGAFYYMVDGIERGDALEFGADYYTGGGKKRPHREYAAVVAASEDALDLALFDDPGEAIAAAERILQEDETSAASGLGEDEIELARRLAGLSEDRLRQVVEAAGELRRDDPASEASTVSAAERA